MQTPLQTSRPPTSDNNCTDLDTGFETELSTSQYTDEQLVESLKKTYSPPILETLVDRHVNRIMRLALRITQNTISAEEIVQNTFLTVIENINSFRGEARFASWLYRVALNTCYKYLSTEQKINTREISIEGQPSMKMGIYCSVDKNCAKTPDEQALQTERIGKIKDAINKLPRKYQVVFQLREIEGLSAKEVGEILDISTNTVKSRMRRARLLLKKMLSEYFCEQPK